ncbi:MAG: transglutaminase domain-containing protein [Oscillospiraceae bacterium]|nr:transglutaminase domain-containing protein [Oscillospiraceae bacterium]
MQKRKWIALLAALALLLSGCGSPAETSSALKQTQSALQGSLAEAGKSQSSDKTGAFVSPPFLDAVFHADAAEGNDSVKLDLSALQDGYVAVSAVSEKRMKFQVICGDETYTYNLSSDGEPLIFPLSCGSGGYRFRVMENVVDSKYAELYSAERSVALSDDFQPFLRPSVYVPYSADSKCVQKAAELASHVDDEIELIGAVYDYICRSIRYDTQKASTVQSGYLPDPDETMKSGKGICFDYAALSAAMLRSQGIPTKEIFGYVSPNDVYHAWNMFYTEQSGWVTVSFETREDDWNRMDATFAANGANDKFIGDGSNYADLYWY